MNGDQPRSRDAPWTVEEAEALLQQLEGVISARIVATPHGTVEEVHLLTSADVEPKKTVRNVESALRARFNLSIDHRKVSVARTHGPPPGPAAAAVPSSPPSEPPAEAPTPPASRPGDGPANAVNKGIIESPWASGGQPGSHGPRLLFVRHRQDRERSRRVRMTVELEWSGRRYEGSNNTLDVPRARLEATAEATLEAVRAILGEAAPSRVTVDLDGVEVIQALDQRYALVAVHGLVDGRFSPLTGVVPVDSDPEQAMILATLRATERPVRIVLGEAHEEEDGDLEADPEPPRGDDPLKLWGGS